MEGYTAWRLVESKDVSHGNWSHERHELLVDLRSPRLAHFLDVAFERVGAVEVLADNGTEGVPRFVFIHIVLEGGETGEIEPRIGFGLVGCVGILVVRGGRRAGNKPSPCRDERENELDFDVVRECSGNLAESSASSVSLTKEQATIITLDLCVEVRVVEYFLRRGGATGTGGIHKNDGLFCESVST